MLHDRCPSRLAMNTPMPFYAAGEDVTAPMVAQLTRAQAYRRARLHKVRISIMGTSKNSEFAQTQGA